MQERLLVLGPVWRDLLHQLHRYQCAELAAPNSSAFYPIDKQQIHIANNVSFCMIIDIEKGELSFDTFFVFKNTSKCTNGNNKLFSFQFRKKHFNFTVNMWPYHSSRKDLTV